MVKGGKRMKKEFRDWLEEKKRVSTYPYLNNGKLIKPRPDIEKELELVIKKYDELHKPAVIPQYVAEWIIRHRDKYDLYPALRTLENNTLVWGQIYEWYRENTHKFVNAFLTGEYEVEEDQKYYVMNEENELILGWSQSAYMTPCIEGYEYMKCNGRENLFQLTEQEIKDYDERYWAFAVEVEEVEKCYLF